MSKRQRLFKAKLKDGQTWKHAGFFNSDVGLTSEELQIRWLNNSISTHNPYIKCKCCKRRFFKKENIYEGFFNVEDNKFKLKTLCQRCAYAISDDVIEYKILDNHELDVYTINLCDENNAKSVK